MVLLGAMAYVAYEVFMGGQSLGQALTFGGVFPRIPGVAGFPKYPGLVGGIGCPSCPKPGIGAIYSGNIYGGYVPMGANVITKTERAYNMRVN